WDFVGDERRNQRFLVLGHARAGATAERDALLTRHRRYFDEHGYRDRFIARGPLLSDDGTEWAGSAMLVELADRRAVETMLDGEPYVRAGLYANLEVHRWQFGGRPRTSSE